LIETDAGNKADMLAGVLKDIDSQIAELEVIIREKERCVAVAISQCDYCYIYDMLCCYSYDTLAPNNAQFLFFLCTGGKAERTAAQTNCSKRTLLRQLKVREERREKRERRRQTCIITYTYKASSCLNIIFYPYDFSDRTVYPV
jgi:hypothetical protein